MNPLIRALAAPFMLLAAFNFYEGLTGAPVKDSWALFMAFPTAYFAALAWLLG